MQQIPIQTRMILIIGLIIVLLFSTTGCFNKSVTGPTWTTKFTMPLIMRAKNLSDPAKSSEIILGDGINGIGEKGLGLTNAGNYALPEETWESAPLGRLGLSLNQLNQYNLSPALSGVLPGTEINLPVTDISSISFTDSDYLQATLSNSPTKNQISISLNGAVAGDAGLTVSFMAGSVQLQQATMAAGQSTVTLSLAGKTLEPNQTFALQLAGSLRKIAEEVLVDFVWNAFEAESFKVAKNLVQSKVDYNLINDPITFSFDLPEELAEAQLAAATLHLLPQMPENLIIKGTLEIQSNLGEVKYIPDITFTNGNTTNQDLTTALNELLANAPRTLRFTFNNIELSGSDDVTLHHTDTVKLNLTASLGLASVATTPQAMKVDSSIDTDTIETTSLIFEITNFSPVAMVINVTLFADDDQNPDNAPPNIDSLSDKITFPINISPGSPGTTVTEKVIATEQLRNLIRNGTVYHQLTVSNTSTEDHQINSSHYLEIRSRAEGRVQVNKSK